MSYEKVRIVKIEERVSRDTGEVRHYLIMERLVPISTRVNDAELRKHYEALKGKIAMVPVVQDSFEDEKGGIRRYWRLEGDGMPMTGAA